jgi:hypothetical protein
MPQDQRTQDAAPAPEPSFGPSGRAAGASQDLSARVAAAVERQPGDTVRCTRVGDDRYRCNWWSAQATGTYDNPSMHGLMVTTHRVRKSLFLRVSQSAAGLSVRLDPTCGTNKQLSADDRRILPGGASVARE